MAILASLQTISVYVNHKVSMDNGILLKKLTMWKTVILTPGFKSHYAKDKYLFQTKSSFTLAIGSVTVLLLPDTTDMI